ncbi:MAG: outer membrane lipoprotein-sorting protein [Archangium sp.]
MTALVLMLVLTAEPPPLKEVLDKYDALMAPPTFKGTGTMIAHRDDGSTRAYKMTFLKGSDGKSRVWFSEPAAVRGQEMLRNGDNFWVYMPNLKRALRLASRDNFQGGDFNNADVLRANYGKDYDGKVKEDGELWLVELKAKHSDAAYDSIKLWVKKSPLGVPVRGEYFTSSGKLLRSATFTDEKDFGNGLIRPAKTVMKNEIATERYSELVWESVDVKAPVSDTKFGLTDLGH